MQRSDGGRTAVVLLNLGGPDSLDAVRPFLFNLFSDPAILTVPAPFRQLLAWAIARRRAPVARDIYARIGNRSPILPETMAQAEALQNELDPDADGLLRCFVSMRYWHPRAAQTVAEVRDWGADQVLLVPLYPQFSTTTSASSIAEWQREAGRQGLNAATRAVCCFPDLPGLAAAQAAGIAAEMDRLARARPDGAPPRILFSAHGLPKKVIAAGDPYQWQVERSVAAVVDSLAEGSAGSLDWRICYQSRVGPLEWIGPATEDEIRQAGQDGVSLVVVPIAFVSEHSETLVELDIEYAELARTCGVPEYRRVPALGIMADFIDSLAGLIAAELECLQAGDSGRVGRSTGRICAQTLVRCPCDRGLAQVDAR